VDYGEEKIGDNLGTDWSFFCPQSGPKKDGEEVPLHRQKLQEEQKRKSLNHVREDAPEEKVALKKAKKKDRPKREADQRHQEWSKPRIGVGLGAGKD